MELCQRESTNLDSSSIFSLGKQCICLKFQLLSRFQMLFRWRHNILVYTVCSCEYACVTSILSYYLARLIHPARLQSDQVDLTLLHC